MKNILKLLENSKEPLSPYLEFGVPIVDEDGREYVQLIKDGPWVEITNKL